MSALAVTIKTLALIASVTVLPFWLIFHFDVPVLPAVIGSVVLCIVLAALWTGGKPSA